MNQRRKRNSSKVNLTISAVFHTILIVGVAFFAAREGVFGKKLKEITATIEPKKKAEAPKAKPVEPKVETVKPVEAPKVAAMAAPPPRVETTAAAPPAASAAVEAPPAVNLAGFEFSDGAKAVQSVSDPNTLYKGLVEHALRSRWNRPEDISDENYIVEVELTVDAEGKVVGSRWLKSSGDARWDNSVKAALASTTTISRPPPKGFPNTFVTRFDVESTQPEDVLQISTR
jgi:TonB family protein